MQLVEQHLIKRTDSRYASIDQASFASKNLYNAALYEMRQTFLFEHLRLTYPALHTRMKNHPAYRELPAKVSQQVLRLLDKNWKSWEEALEAWKIDPSKFLGRPSMPKYLEKQQGRFLLVYTLQALSGGRGKGALQQGIIKPSGLPMTVQTQQKSIDQVRIVPRKGHYVVEVVYEQPCVQARVNPAWMASIDIGVNNLAAITSNKEGFVPRIVNGRPLKSTNQFYNKRKAELQSLLPEGQDWTARMERMTTKRTRRIDHYLHTASRGMIDLLVAEEIGTLIIGKNTNWKQECQLRKKDKQHFVQLPHARFVEMLCYKAKLVGIQVILQEESYTSAASFLDLDPLPVYGQVEEKPQFSGRRIKRGLYRSLFGTLINADCNGSYNILRKASPAAFEPGCRGCVVHPVRLHVPTRV